MIVFTVMQMTGQGIHFHTTSLEENNAKLFASMLSGDLIPTKTYLSKIIFSNRMRLKC